MLPKLDHPPIPSPHFTPRLFKHLSQLLNSSLPTYNMPVSRHIIDSRYNAHI